MLSSWPACHAACLHDSPRSVSCAQCAALVSDWSLLGCSVAVRLLAVGGTGTSTSALMVLLEDHQPLPDLLVLSAAARSQP